MSSFSEIAYAFSSKPVFTRSEIIDYIRTQKPTIKDSTTSWFLYNLCQKGIIQRIAHDAYRLYVEDNPLKKYETLLSDDAADIAEFLVRQYPLLTFIVWESFAFNEFATHQMVRNYIFVEVEKPLGESVFHALHGQGGYLTLYRPSEKEISLYSGGVTVSVLPLTSEAPINGNNAKLEKLLVDLFANKLLDCIISRGDYPAIYEEAFSRYIINYNMMLRYAKRRNKQAEIKRFISEKTNVAVVGKEKTND